MDRIPARDVFGLRLADSRSGDIGTPFHCRTQFYLPGTDWVTADPADVRKMMLEHNIRFKVAGKWEKFFRDGDDLFRKDLDYFSPKDFSPPSIMQMSALRLPCRLQNHEHGRPRWQGVRKQQHIEPLRQ